MLIPASIDRISDEVDHNEGGICLASLDGRDVRLRASCDPTGAAGEQTV
jgi:hypothetical protein